MVIVLVHWLIEPGQEKAFESWWGGMAPKSGVGMYHETLTRIASESKDPRFHTFSIGDPYYTTYLNIGYWESTEHFEKAIRIPNAEQVVEPDGSKKLVIKMEPFEFKVRERIFLEGCFHRGDHALADVTLRPLPA